jgi:hypothetical protein
MLSELLSIPAKPIFYFPQNIIYQKDKLTKSGKLPTSNAFFGHNTRIWEEGKFT